MLIRVSRDGKVEGDFFENLALLELALMTECGNRKEKEQEEEYQRAIEVMRLNQIPKKKRLGGRIIGYTSTGAKGENMGTTARGRIDYLYARIMGRAE